MKEKQHESGKEQTFEGEYQGFIIRGHSSRASFQIRLPWSWLGYEPLGPAFLWWKHFMKTIHNSDFLERLPSSESQALFNSVLWCTSQCCSRGSTLIYLFPRLLYDIRRSSGVSFALCLFYYIAWTCYEPSQPIKRKGFKRRNNNSSLI